MLNLKVLVAMVVISQYIASVHPYCYIRTDANCKPGLSEVIDCADCSCSDDGTTLYCCFNIGRPTRMTPGCKAEFNAETCQFDISNQDSPGTECRVYAMTGR